MAGLKVFGFIGLLFGALQVWAAPTSVCQRTCDTIQVDGQLTETTWKRAVPLSPLRDLSGRKAAYQADIRMAYDDTCLYFAAVLPAKTLLAKLTERDSIIYHDDDFEIFIDPACTGRNYVELEINQLNTVWDLFITAPYREGEACVALHDWDIKGLKTAVTHQGTLNQGEDDDISWTVEVAWPWESITGHSHLPRRGEAPKDGTVMRFNFSRVDHPLKPDGTRGEVNTVWAPTRQATIHAPEHWGLIRFSDAPVGTPEAFPPQVGLWVHGNDKTLTPDHVKAWADAGITQVVIDGPVDRIDLIAGWAKACGLKTVAWVWSLNRPDDAVALQHPDWYAVSAEGKSCHAEADRPFVPYYQFLCPTHPEVRAHLADWVKQICALDSVDAIQLDYIRLPDVVLPCGLWKNYGLDMSTILPPYDFCYCARCRKGFEEAAPTDKAWIDHRLQAVADVANHLADTARAAGKPCGAAVFPTPRLAAEMVRQDWSRFSLDFAFPMVYASFYEETNDWITACVQEAKTVLANSAVGPYPVYPGLHLPDFKGDDLRNFLPELLKANPAGFCLFSHETFTPEVQRVLRAVLKGSAR